MYAYKNMHIYAHECIHAFTLCICVVVCMTQWGASLAVAGSQAYSLQLQQVFPYEAKPRQGA